MATRREFVFSALAAAGGMATLPSCSFGSGVESYEDFSRNTWRHGRLPPSLRRPLQAVLV